MQIKELKKHCEDQLKRNFHREEHELILNLINKKEKEIELKQEIIDYIDYIQQQLSSLHNLNANIEEIRQRTKTKNYIWLEIKG